MPYFGYRGYISDDTTKYAQRISSEIAEAVDNSGSPAPAFGWEETIVTGNVFRPTEVTMRCIDLVSADGTKRRRVPVGNIADASLWENPSLTVDLQDALGNSVTYSVVGLIGERRRYPRPFAF